ncbi:MAG: acetylornithine transaminase [Candidatus Nanopelagicales bacterium]
MSATEALQKRWSDIMLGNYGLPPVALARGEGAWVWDVDGARYLDLVGGIAVSSLGHAHPAVVEAVTRQVGMLVHTSNLAMHEPGIALAERLAALVPVPAKVFLCQDGATANEAALKIARKRGNALGRDQVVSTHGGFHGRTAGALAVTGTPAKRTPFEPLPGGVEFVEYGDAEALRSVVGPRTAAVIVEPVQGEGGVVLPPPGYLAAVRAICDAAGALMICDEVQSGIGRGGSWLMSVDQGVVPDVVTLAKGLGAGMPIGAVIATGEARDVLVPGDHGTTFGGNPVSCAAALAVLGTIESEGLLQHVRDLGERWAASFDAVDHPLLASHRGVGLWRALELAEPLAGTVETVARSQGFLVNAVRPSTIRLAPPLVLSEEQADSFSAALPGLLDTAGASS